MKKRLASLILALLAVAGGVVAINGNANAGTVVGRLSVGTKVTTTTKTYGTQTFALKTVTADRHRGSGANGHCLADYQQVQYPKPVGVITGTSIQLWTCDTGRIKGF